MTISPIRSDIDEALMRQSLAKIESFEGWSPSDIDSILPAARLGRYGRGDMVMEEGAGEPQVVVLLAGHLLGSRAYPEGERVPLFIFSPGYVAGIQPPLESEKHVLYVYEAHDDVVAISLPLTSLMGALDARPLLWRTIAKGVIRHHRSIAVMLLDHQTGSTRQRLAATISRLTRTYGVDHEAGSLRLRVSQDDLAALLQVSRQSINREMRALEDLNLISARYGAVIVHQLEALRQMGGNTGGTDSSTASTE